MNTKINFKELEYEILGIKQNFLPDRSILYPTQTAKTSHEYEIAEEIENFKNKVYDNIKNNNLYEELLKDITSLNLKNISIDEYINKINKYFDVNYEADNKPVLILNDKVNILTNLAIKLFKTLPEKLLLYLIIFNVIDKKYYIKKDTTNSESTTKKSDKFFELNIKSIQPLMLEELRKIILYIEKLYKHGFSHTVDLNFIDVSKIDEPNFYLKYNTAQIPFLLRGIFEDLDFGFADKLDISKWEFSKNVENIRNMFKNTNINVKLPESLKRSKIKNINEMFSGNSKFNDKSIENLNGKYIKEAKYTFYKTTSFNQDLTPLEWKQQDINIFRMLEESGINSENLINTVLYFSELKNIPYEEISNIMGNTIFKKIKNLKSERKNLKLNKKIRKTELEELFKDFVDLIKEKPELKEKLLNELNIN